MSQRRRLTSVLLRSAVVLVAIAVSRPALAVDPLRAITQYTQRNWQTGAGLPQNSVQAIVQTDDGFLWLGTQEGLVRFDGTDFIVFDRTNTPAMKRNAVYALATSRDGGLWVGTNEGLLRLHDGVFRAYGVADGLPQPFVRCLFEDRGGTLWIGTPDAGVTTFRDGRVSPIRDQPLLSSAVIASVAEGPDGSLWFATTRGVLRLQNESLQQYLAPAGRWSDDVRAVWSDSSGTIWAGTATGLIVWQDGRFERFRTPGGQTIDDQVRVIHGGREGGLWVGTDSGGIRRIWRGRVDRYDHRKGLPSDAVASILGDRDGSVWVGTLETGLVCLSDGVFSGYTTKDGLAGDQIRAVYQARDDSIWIGAVGGGLSHLHNGSVTNYTTREGLIDNAVRAIAEDREGNLWIGTENGLSHLRNGHFENYGDVDGIRFRGIRSLLVDREDTLWIAVAGKGLIQFKNQRARRFGAGTPTWDFSGRAMIEGHAGTLWVGGHTGLVSVRQGEIHTYGPSDGLGDSVVLSLYEDREGVLWVGTFGGGIVRMKNGRFFAYTVSSGLFDNVAFSILEDDDGNLWVTCNRGVYRVSKRELNDLADGKLDGVTSTAYGVPAGMKAAECNAGAPGGWRSRDGRMWFATIAGVAVVDPGDANVRPRPPPSRIERVIVDGREFEPRHPFDVEHGEGKIQFQYSGLSLTNPEGIRFRFRLDGFDADWVEAGTRREAFYTNVPPGFYRFEVIASYDRLLWSPEAATATFRLTPHFYETTWFRMLTVMSAFGFIAGSHRFRVRRSRARESELVRLVQDRTQALRQEIAERESAQCALSVAKDVADAANRSKSEFLANMSHEIRTPLNGIIGMTALALDTPLTAEQKEYLDTVTTSADTLLTVINDVLDFSKIEAGRLDLESTTFDLREVVSDAAKLLRPKAVERRLELLCRIAPEVPDSVIGDPVRLRQVLTNLLSNAIKFTHAGEVLVEVVPVDGAVAGHVALHFQVKDTGIGIPLEKRAAVFDAFVQADGSTTREYGGTGLGLTICNRLVGMMQGRIWLDSTPGQGSVFHFTAVFEAGSADGSVASATGSVDLQDLPVLIVDDNATNRRILREMVRIWGMRPTTADCGAAALAALRRAHEVGDTPRLVLLDEQMPEMDGLDVAARIRELPWLSATRIIILTSSSVEGGATRLARLGISAALSKPLRQADVRGAIMRAFADAPATRIVSPLPSALENTGERSLDVLVAEDNPVNQRLAVKLLEKRGHRVTVASNGREAIGFIGAHAFDAVIMDVQMPEMNGFDATEAIRLREKETGGHVPIIAMTAHAMKGDCERCLAAGMDDYLTKPIDPAELMAMLGRWTNRTAPPEAAAPHPAEWGEPALDRTLALARACGDEDVLRELAGLLRETGSALLSDIQQAVDRCDADTLHRAAHQLRGSVGNFGAVEAAALAADLERFGREGRPEQATVVCRALSVEMERLDRALGTLVAGGRDSCERSI